jgi:hypothetical protein
VITKKLRMRMALFATILLTIFKCAPSALALDCSPPPQQFAQNVDVQGEARAEGLLKRLFDGSLGGKVSIVAQDLLSKYPNSDRTVIALGLLSMYCQIIGGSSANEHEKLEMLGKANEDLLKWASAPRSEKTDSYIGSIQNNRGIITQGQTGGQNTINQAPKPELKSISQDMHQKLTGHRRHPYWWRL